MESIAITSAERKDLISSMKREIKPSRRLRMHIVLLASEGYSPTEISRSLFCWRTTVYAVFGRFVLEGQRAFDDRRRRGPAPLVEGSAQKLLEDLAEGVLPTERGWLRSRWSCKLLALEFFKDRALVVSRETVRPVLHRLNFRWRRPRPVPPPKDCSYFQDETKLETNPRVGFCWMRKGKQKRLRTPGTNRKVWISALSRNHNCEELSDLVQFAEGYLEERQPFRLRLAEDNEHLERSPP
jgi:putative transposase